MPLPDGPTMPSSGAPTSRATSSATSRSRPKKYWRVGDLERGQPLERAHHRRVVVAVQRDAARRAACSSTTPPASSASIERSSARPAAARPATAPTRRAASRRAHWPRDLVDAAGDAAAGLEQPLDGHVLAAWPGAWRTAIARTAVGVERLERERAVGAEACERLGVFPARERQHGNGGERARQLVERGEHVSAGLVGIVDDEQRRARRLAGAAQRDEDRSAGPVPAA